MLDDKANLKGKVAVIIGGGGGIGRAVTLALAGMGVDVALCDNDSGSLAETAREAERGGVTCLAVEADVLSPQAIEDFYTAIAAQFERLDIVVNVAGGVHQRDFLTGTDEQDAEDIRRNYGYVIQSIRLAVPLLERGGGGGSVINFTTIESRRGAAGFAVYAGAKAATANLTRALAVELASRGIRVNEIAPDTTPSTGNANALTPERRKMLQAMEPGELAAAMATYIPLGAPPSAEQLADAVLFLASDLAQAITGITVPVDGGTSAAMGFLNWPYGAGFGPAPTGLAAKHLFSGRDA